MDRDSLELAFVIVVEEGTPNTAREGTIFGEGSLLVAAPKGLSILRSRAGHRENHHQHRELPTQQLSRRR